MLVQELLYGNYKSDVQYTVKTSPSEDRIEKLVRRIGYKSPAKNIVRKSLSKKERIGNLVEKFS